ncbi:phage integrase N-terminal SAM-like domain-containing protein [bacterium]|nr:phage integrase N-terminal SAM-like domain-containing protein [bacterium]
MNELQRLKQLQQQIVNPTIEGVPQIDALEQMQLRMLGDMQLQGLAERTQESYVRGIRKLAEHDGKGPDQISDEEIWEYFMLWGPTKTQARTAPLLEQNPCGHGSSARTRPDA